MTTQNTRMLQRRDTAANWNLNNPVLGVGEIGYETDTGKMKVGDGVSNWVSLTYFTDIEFASNAEVIAGTEANKAVSPVGGTEYVIRNAAGTQIIFANVQFSTIPRVIGSPVNVDEAVNKGYVDTQFTISAGSPSQSGLALRLDGSGKFPASAIPATSLPYATNGEADAGVAQDKVINPAVGAHAYLRKNAGGTQTVNTQTDFVAAVLSQNTPSLNNHVTRLVDLNGRFQANSFDTGSAFAGKGVVLDADGKIDSLILPPITGTGTFLGSFDPETGIVVPGTLSAPVDGDPLREDGEYWVVAIASGATSWHWDFANGVPSAGPEAGRVIELFIGDQVLYEDVSAIWHVAALGKGGAAGSYLPLNGSQPMSGNISMGGNQVNDATQVGGSGVIICNANSFHLDLGDLQTSDGVAGRNYLAHKNSNISGQRPTNLGSGELAFNIADRTSYIGVAGTVHGMSAPRWSDGAQYKVHDVVTRDGGIYTAIADNLNEDPIGASGPSFWFPLSGTPVSTNTTIHVNDATGDDTNGNGSSGQPYKTITKALTVIYSMLPLSGVLITVQVAAGVYSSQNLSFPGAYPFAGQVTVIGVDPGAGNYIDGMPLADYSIDHTNPATSTPGLKELRNTAGQLGTNATSTAWNNARSQDKTDNGTFLRTQYQTIIEPVADCITQTEGGPLVGSVEHMMFDAGIFSLVGVNALPQNTGVTKLKNVAFHGMTQGIFNTSPSYSIISSEIGTEEPLIITGSSESAVYLRNGAIFNARILFIQGGSKRGIDAIGSQIGRSYYLNFELDPTGFTISGCGQEGVNALSSQFLLSDCIISGNQLQSFNFELGSSMQVDSLELQGSPQSLLLLNRDTAVDVQVSLKLYGAVEYGIFSNLGSTLRTASFDIKNTDVGVFGGRNGIVTCTGIATIRDCDMGIDTLSHGVIEIGNVDIEDSTTRDIFIRGMSYGYFINATLGQNSSTSPQGVAAIQGSKVIIPAPGSGNIHASVVYSPAFDTLNNSAAWIGLT